MSNPSNGVAGLESREAAPATFSPTRPMYWSVRREVWENRSLYIAPVIVACVVVLGFLFSMIGMPERRRAVILLDATHQRAGIEAPYDIAAGMLILTAFLVGVFYCLDALYGERRDRSILFWKSLPVSDVTTVLSKAAVPLVVLPVLSYAVIIATQLIMLMLSTIVLLLHHPTAAMLLPQLKYTVSPLGLLYGLTVIALWHAPVYAWLLLVSGWAKRATFLWAILPFVAIAFFERIAFNSTHFLMFIRYRLFGWFIQGFDVPQPRTVPELAPWKFLSTPGLWIGLAFAVAFLAAAVRLRRYRDPI